jgi:hypothetical protein
MKECFMLKKSLIFGSAALVLLALIALTGCSQATDGDKTVRQAENYIYSGATPDAAQKVIDRAIATNRPVVLVDAEFTGDGVVDFKGVPIQVEGKVTVNSASGELYVNAAKSVITYDEELKSGITVTGGYFIYQGEGEEIRAEPQSPLTPAKRVRYTTNPLAVTGTVDHIALDAYTLAGAACGDIQPEVETVIVLQDLTVTRDSKSPADKNFIVLGTVDVTGTNLEAFAKSQVKFGPNSVLTTTSLDPVGITLPTTGATIYNVKGNEGITLTIGEANAVVPNDVIHIAGLVEGSLKIAGAATTNTVISYVNIAEVAPGAVVEILPSSFNAALTAAVGPFAIDAGGIEIKRNAGLVKIAGTTFATPSKVNVPINDPTGEVYFTTIATFNLADFVVSPRNDGVIKFEKAVTVGAGFTGITGGSGKVVFSEAVTQGAFTLNFGTDVVLEAGLTHATAAGDLIFGGNVTLYKGQKIEYVYPGSLSTPAEQFTLKAGKGIYVDGQKVFGAGAAALKFGGTASDAFVITNPNPTGGGSLWTPEDDTAAPVEYSALRVTGLGAGAGFTGVLQVASGGILVLDGTSVAQVVALTPTTNSLVLEDGATVLLHAGASTQSSIQIGNAAGIAVKIPGTPASGTLATVSAQGGVVVIDSTGITGKNPGAQLFLADVEARPAEIAVTSTTIPLNLQGVDLNVATAGSVRLITGGGKLTLAPGTNPGKITLNPVEAGTPVALTETELGTIPPAALGTGTVFTKGEGAVITTGGGTGGTLYSIAASSLAAHASVSITNVSVAAGFVVATGLGLTVE